MFEDKKARDMSDELSILEIRALKLEVTHEVLVSLPAWKLRAWFGVSDITKNVLVSLERKLNADGTFPVSIQAYNDGTKHGVITIAKSNNVRPVHYESKRTILGQTE